MTRSSSRSATLLAIAGLVGLAGCNLESTGPDPAVLLQGPLEPTDPMSTITGSVAAVSQSGNTDISIGVQGLDPDEPYAWYLRTRTCSGNGEIIGSFEAYPRLEPDPSGAADADHEFSLELESGESYAAELLVDPDGAAEVLACADMVEQ